jgi:peptidoglycan/LPS O-acetylase OafA/YrhL
VIAALLVFVFHAVSGKPPTTQNFWVDWPWRLAQQGNVGVSIFFVLSGFLITTRYYNTSTLSWAWFRSYLQNRFARIYPLYFLVTVVAFAVMQVHLRYTWYEWTATISNFDKVIVLLLNLTLTRAYSHTATYWGVPSAWTLTVEESFYLSAPFLLLGLKRNFRLLYLYPLLFLLLGAGAVVVCTRLGLPFGIMDGMAMMLRDTFFGRCIEFLLGMGLASWMSRSTQFFYNQATATTIGIVGIVVGMLVLYTLRLTSPLDSSEVSYLTTLVSNVLLPLPIVGLLWGLIHERTWLQKLLQTRVFDLLGKSSYAFYLIHVGTIDDLFIDYISGHWLVRLVAYTFLSIALYRWVESPLHRLLRAKRDPAPQLATK